MDKVVNLRKCVKSMIIDAEKFFLKNNNSAGVRIRKKLQNCKKISQEIRNLVQFIKFKFIQKKAKIKAAQAAYFGGNILTSQKFRLFHLRENNFKNANNQNTDGFFVEKKNNPQDFSMRINKHYDLENLLKLKSSTPLPTYSIFNYEN